MTWAVFHNMSQQSVACQRNPLFTQITRPTHSLFPEGRKAVLASLADLQQKVYPQSRHMSNYWSGAGQGKLIAGQRPALLPLCYAANF